MAFMLEQNKPLNPFQIRLFRADAKVLQANLVPYLILSTRLCFERGVHFFHWGCCFTAVRIDKKGFWGVKCELYTSAVP